MELISECQICSEDYTSERKPRILPCGHTYCTPCLRSMHRQTRLECPGCRTTHRVTSVDGLTVNFQLIVDPSIINPQMEPMRKQLEEYSQSLRRAEENFLRDKEDADKRIDWSWKSASEKLENMEQAIRQAKEKMHGQIQTAKEANHKSEGEARTYFEGERKRVSQIRELIRNQRNPEPNVVPNNIQRFELRTCILGSGVPLLEKLSMYKPASINPVPYQRGDNRSTGWKYEVKPGKWVFVKPEMSEALTAAEQQGQEVVNVPGFRAYLSRKKIYVIDRSGREVNEKPLRKG